MAKRKNNTGTSNATAASVGYVARDRKNGKFREQQAEAARLDAATRLRQAERGRQVAANLKELGYGR